LLKNLKKRLVRRSAKSGDQHTEKSPSLPQGAKAPSDQQPRTKSEIPKAAPTATTAKPPVALSLIPVVTGLDFGTFSTKVVARRRNEREATVLCLDEPCPGYPCFTVPSLVRVVQGKVFFGKHAACGDGGHLFRSLKVSLLTGSFPPTDVGLRPDELVALYLAWLLRRVEQWLTREYGANRTNVFVNAAAPMNHYEEPALRKRYLRIINAAWNAGLGQRSIEVEQGASLSALRPWLDEWMDHRTRIEPIETRRFEVLPETVAPIVSLSRDPHMSAGMYLIVDMGAGTTEFSVNHAAEPGGNHGILCYYDQSVLLGAEQFQSPPPGESEESLTRNLLKEMCKTWGRGYTKDSNSHAARHRWKELTVLLAGGGTSRPELRDKIAKHRNAVMYAFQGLDCRYSVKTHFPRELDFRAAEPERNANGFLLSVAHGLSYPKRTWPDFVEPHDVTQMTGTPRAGSPDLPWFDVG